MTHTPWTAFPVLTAAGVCGFGHVHRFTFIGQRKSFRKKFMSSSKCDPSPVQINRCNDLSQRKRRPDLREHNVSELILDAIALEVVTFAKYQRRTEQ
jgi:hypothetical protein